MRPLRENQSRQKVAILKVLQDSGESLGSSHIADELQAHGFDLCGRTVRLYLQEMEQEGLVTQAKRGRDGGRALTYLGHEEIRNALVKERVGFMASRVDSLACQVTFDPQRRSGLVVLNATILERSLFPAAVREMIPVFRASLGMGKLVAVARPGERLGAFSIPPGKVGIGTVCSVTLNGILLSARIPTRSVFGGVLEIGDGRPVRFTDVIYYSGTSLDPLEIFIKGKLTSVRKTARTGNGRIGASFREFPSPALPEVERISPMLHEIGIGGCLLIGKPNRDLLEFPVEEDRTGFLVCGGLNPVAAVEEAGIPASNHALCTLYDYERLLHYEAMADLLAREEF
jgi:HTH-type transcriptional regulator, global nitrogen regulator NrpRI